MALVELTKIGSSVIEIGLITELKFANSSVTTIKIDDNAALESNFATNSIIESKILDNTIVADNIVNFTITDSDLSGILDLSGSTVTLPKSISPVDWSSSSYQTTSFTAELATGYYVDTTSGSVTITLPASPIVGDFVAVVDVSSSSGSNSIVIFPNGLNLNGGTSNLELNKNRNGILLVYSGSSQGWIAVDSANENTTKIFVDTLPVIDSVSPNFFQADGNTITITGKGFQPGCSITLTGANSTTYTQNTVTVSTNHSQATFQIPTGMVASLPADANDPFDITVTNPDTNISTLNNCLDATSPPTFTNSGSLGTLFFGESYSDLTSQPTAVVLDSDETPTYSLASGSLPSGMSLNTSTGAIEGTPSDYGIFGGSSTTYNFSVTASITSDFFGISGSNTESFSITIEPNYLAIDSVSPTDYDGESLTNITITGNGFQDSSLTITSIEFITSGATVVNAPSYTVNSNTEIVVQTPQDFLVSDGPLSIKITLSDSTSETLSNALTTGTAPNLPANNATLDTIARSEVLPNGSWSGTSIGGTDDGTIASYSLDTPFSGGSLSLNPTTGAVTGSVYVPQFPSGGNISFAVSATDNAGNITGPRTYNIPVDPPPSTSSWRTGGNMLLPLALHAGTGDQNAGLTVTGYTPTADTNKTQEYNGTSWSYGGNYLLPAWSGTVAGTQNDALFAVGPGGPNYVGTYNGSTWNNLPSSLGPVVGVPGVSQWGYSSSFGSGSSSFTIVAGTYGRYWDGVSWATISPSPYHRLYTFAAGGDYNSGWIAGGDSNITFFTTSEYNGSTWSNTGNLNLGRYAGCGDGTQNDAFITGGSTRQSNPTSPFAPIPLENSSNSIETYNGSTWSNSSPFSVKRRFHASGGSNSTSGFICGGLPLTNAYLSSTEELFIYE